MSMTLRPRRRLIVPACLAAATAACPPWALAQTSDSGVLRPTASVSQTVTDNAETDRPEKSADAITRLTAGLSYSSQSGAVKGFANYALSQTLYLRNSKRNVLQNALNANLRAELVEQRAYLDVVSTVSQIAKSAFGAQQTNDGRSNSNTSEVATLSLAPHWKGVFNGAVAYSANGAYTVSNATGAASVGDVTTRSAGIELGPATARRLGWSVGAHHDISNYKTGRSIENDRLNVGASWQVPDADLVLRTSVGREFGDLAALHGGGGDAWSTGFSWVPSQRTALDVMVGRRPFGDTYQLGLSYRTPQTVWRAAASRDLTSTNGVVRTNLGTAYDLFFAQFASVEPDPVRRAALVESFLSRNGIAADSVVQAGFLTAAQTVNERLELSTAWRSARSTVMLSVSHNQSHRVDLLTQVNDDFSRSDRVRISALVLALSHQLSPVLTANVDLRASQGRGDLASQNSRIRSAVFRLGGTASARATWSVAARRSLTETGLRATSESSLTGTYTMQF